MRIYSRRRDPSTSLTVQDMVGEVTIPPRPWPDLQWVRHLPQFPAVILHSTTTRSGRSKYETYHQDLDYYDFGDPQASVAAGGGVDERVRDWIVDVERQSSEHLTPMDKYSQKTSSKCWCHKCYSSRWDSGKWFKS